MPTVPYIDTPVGVINGVNKDFTIARTPDEGSVQAFNNGLFAESTVSGLTVTYETAPVVGDVLLVRYTVSTAAAPVPIPDTTWTAADLTAVESALASGELSVRFENRSVQYRSIDELLKIRDVIKNAVAVSGGSSAGIRSTYATFYKD